MLSSVPFVSLEYIWIGGSNTHTDIRSKTRTVTPSQVEQFLSHKNDILDWNCDGSSTGQTSSGDTEIIIKPKLLVYDPFRGKPHMIALCECYLPNDTPHISNTRNNAEKIFTKYRHHQPWFGLEQEYFLSHEDTHKALGTHRDYTSNKYYCGNGADRMFARNVLEEHYQMCLYSGLTISGYNAEVVPGQYEFQIGPVEGIRAADELILARYFLIRVCEKYQLIVNFNPKPYPYCNGSGLHHNFSTIDMREPNGYIYIELACEKLRKNHEELLAVYGDNNKERLSGSHEAPDFHSFTFGVGTRNTSIRIPNQVAKLKCGYFEDRRPAANCDPYLSTSKLFLTCVE